MSPQDLRRLHLRPLAQWSVLAASAMWVSACTTQDGSQLTWNVSFACGEEGARAEQVLVGIAEGECPGAEVPLYQVSVPRGGPIAAAAPGSLPAGNYAFFAVARDAAGVMVAEACITVALPGSEKVELQLAGSTQCVAHDSNQDGGAPDDASAAPDCQTQDSDLDGISNCDDGCPQDPGKSSAGTCGCGAAEPFDVASFRDAMNYACSDWKDYDCTQAKEQWMYTAAQEAQLLASCSKTCGECPP